jgi:predicted alpha/beta superfamily hydrolase
MKTFRSSSSPHALLSSYTHPFHSAILQDDLKISVSLPHSYDHQPGQFFPILYVLDADLFFGLVTDMTRLMHIDGACPEVIVVGLGYPLHELYGSEFQRFIARRHRDFSPVADPMVERELESWLGLDRVPTGGARRFLQVIEQEVLPMVEAEYRAFPGDRALLGHSAGGMFALYALWQEPSSFRRFVIGSPPLGWGEGALFTLESDYAREHDRLPARVFLGIGKEEETSATPLDALVSVSAFHRFVTVMEHRQYKELALASKVFEGQTHCTVVAPLFLEGIRYAFAS